MPVTILQHVACESPGLLEELLVERGIDMRIVRLDMGDEVPQTLAADDGLVIMGGPMSVLDVEEYPWIQDELRLIETTLDADQPILGICLGSQLLATALGEEVVRGPQPEIGWQPVELNASAAHDRLFNDLASPFMAFHWHADTFEAPPGAVNLAHSTYSPCQAFAVNQRAYGLLFHLEVLDATVEKMLDSFGPDIAPLHINPAAVRRGCAECIGNLHEIGAVVFNRWLDLLSA